MNILENKVLACTEGYRKNKVVNQAKGGGVRMDIRAMTPETTDPKKWHVRNDLRAF